MENSGFSDDNKIRMSSNFIKIKKINTSGATSENFKVRKYGKLLFLKRPSDINNSQLQDAFRKEFEVGFNLDHNGIVRYVDFDEETYSIFTEWIEGSTLSQFIEDNPDYFCSQSNCTRFITQLLEAVGYLHSHSVIHLDLKPDNIMISDLDHSVKIIDLGFSLSNCFDTTPGFTPFFAAPEQKEHGSLDCRSDIYAIGRIIEYIYSKINAQPPRRIKHFIANCTESNPNNRYQSATAAIKALQPSKHNVVTIAAIATILALVILGCVTYLLLRNQGTNNIDNSQNLATVADTIIADTISPQSIEVKHIDSTSTATTIRPVDSIKQITANPTVAPPAPNIPITPPITPPTPKPIVKKLTPAEKLDSAEAQMGMFAMIRGYYPIKKEWFARQYRLFDQLRTEYLATDTAQNLGNHRIHYATRALIERDKHIVASKFPDTDMNTILAVAQDINVVIIYLCYSDHRLFSSTNEMNHQFYDFARRKAALLK